MAEAALAASQKERQAAEIMQRTARETAERFAERASRDSRPQLDMMERHHDQLKSAVQGMNVLSSQNALMITKITPFTGNPRDFKRFMANFENNVTKKCTDDSIKLNFLIESCEGDAKSLIEDCVLLKTNAFQKALELLQEEYGQKTDIAADYLQFLKSGQEIKGTDVDALTKLAQDMTKCAVTLKEIGYEHDLEAQATLDTIVDRLPSYMRTKWVDKANEKRKKDERASFDTLREFIADRARALRSSHGKHYIEKLNATASNTSVSSKASQQSKKQTKQGKQISTTTTLTTQSSATQPSKPTGSAPNTDKKRECIFCNKTDHHVSECSGFTKASLSDRTNFVKEKHLCYNCLHVGHGTYVCRNKARCTKCNRKHHDLIHDDAFIKKENNEETSTPSATISCTLQSRNVYLRTLPVRISNGDKEIIAVALLDGGAQSSLGTEDLFNKLGAFPNQY